MPLEPLNALISSDTLDALLALALVSPGGCFVEVGVYQGGSARHLNTLGLEEEREVYLYDTFCGMPHFHSGLDAHPLGDFADTSLERIQALCPTAIVTSGVFPESALPMPPIAFAHVDVDNYRCVHETAEYLKDRMAPGGVIWFDDSPCLAGAAKATKEVFGDTLELSRTGQHYVRME